MAKEWWENGGEETPAVVFKLPAREAGF